METRKTVRKKSLHCSREPKLSSGWPERVSTAGTTSIFTAGMLAALWEEDFVLPPGPAGYAAYRGEDFIPEKSAKEEKLYSSDPLGAHF